MRSSSVIWSAVVVVVWAPLALQCAAALASAVMHGHRTTGGACHHHSNANITSPNLAAEKYLFSAGACCAYCEQTTGCVAATYADYMCAPKGTLSIVDSQGGMVVSLGTLPPPSSSSSSSPPAASTPEPTSTEVPTPVPGATSAPPASTTSAPLATDLVVITNCIYSSSCNKVNDSTCVSQVFELGRCYPDNDNNVSYLYEPRRGGQFERKHYQGTNCSGSATIWVPRVGVCELRDGGYIEYNFVSAPIPSAGCPLLLRTMCSGGMSCAADVFRNGGCELTGSYHSDLGGSTRVLGGGHFLWWRVYDSNDCSGDYVSSFADPLNATYTSSSGESVTWACTSTIPDTPAPNGYITVIGDTICESAPNCSVVVDATCRTRAVISGTCNRVESGDGNAYGEIRTCDAGGRNGFVETRRFDDTRCMGDSHDTIEVQDNCTFNGGEGRHELIQCLDIPTDGHRFVTMRSCTSASEPRSCRNALYLEGQCMSTSPESIHEGASILVYCSARHAWWRTFQAANCAGSALQSRLEVLNEWFEASDGSMHRWSCEEPPATTAVPARSVGLLFSTACTYSSTCNEANDTTCVTTVVNAEGECLANSVGLGEEYLCYPDLAVRRNYQGTTCNGSVYEQSYPLGRCSEGNSGEGYIERRCLTFSLASKGNPAYAITMESCADSSDGSNPGCTNTTFTPGVCQQSAIVYCAGHYVWRQDFADSSCDPSALVSSRGHRVGVQIPNYPGFVLWSCAAP